jgi:hypothetical protein
LTYLNGPTVVALMAEPDLYRLTLTWDVPEEAIDALVADFEEVAQKHGASMPDLWEEARHLDGSPAGPVIEAGPSEPLLTAGEAPGPAGAPSDGTTDAP